MTSHAGKMEVGNLIFLVLAYPLVLERAGGFVQEGRFHEPGGLVHFVCVQNV